MSAFDLTTVDTLKAWMGITTTDTDAIIARNITAASRAILGFIGRPNIMPQVWTERYDGRVGLRRVILRNWPVISVQSLVVAGTPQRAVDPASPAYGYCLEADSWGGVPPGAPQALELFYALGEGAGMQGITVSYTAGYQETETFTVPIGGGTFTTAGVFGAWALDCGVTYAATGAALTRVASAPGAGQYSVSAIGVYTFAAADNGTDVSISYGFVPADLAQACVETAALRVSAGQRVGVKSKSLGGQETVSYDTAAIPDAAARAIQAYKRVAML